MRSRYRVYGYICREKYDQLFHRTDIYLTFDHILPYSRMRNISLKQNSFRYSVFHDQTAIYVSVFLDKDLIPFFLSDPSEAKSNQSEKVDRIFKITFADFYGIGDRGKYVWKIDEKMDKKTDKSRQNA